MSARAMEAAEARVSEALAGTGVDVSSRDTWSGGWTVTVDAADGWSWRATWWTDGDGAGHVTVCMWDRGVVMGADLTVCEARAWRTGERALIRSVLRHCGEVAA